MSTTIRVLPQPGSIGAQRNQIAKKNEQIVDLRQQVSQLRQQLAAFTAGSSMYGGVPGAYRLPQQFPTSFANPFASQTPALSGWGQLLGGLFGGFGGAPQKVGYGTSPYSYTPGYASRRGAYC
jgi:hypothetical protein